MRDLTGLPDHRGREDHLARIAIFRSEALIGNSWAKQNLSEVGFAESLLFLCHPKKTKTMDKEFINQQR
jgi:hypothetical protein